MNIKLYITFSFLFAPFFFLCGQTKKDTLSFRVVSYNVENLFDCRHDTLKNDYEFQRFLLRGKIARGGDCAS